MFPVRVKMDSCTTEQYEVTSQDETDMTERATRHPFIIRDSQS